MRVLVACFVESIHAVRAVGAMTALGWDVHVVPSHRHWAHPGWRDVTLYHDPEFEPKEVHESVRVRRLEPAPGETEPVIEGLSWRQRAAALAHLIEGLAPDLLDSMEIQHGGYLVLEARALLQGEPPPWLVHNWGSDVYYYRRSPRHESRLRGVLSSCDYYGCECGRDVALAETLGFAGEMLPVLPNAGGFDLPGARALRAPGPVSGRRVIALKAAQTFVYRPDVALAALERCADLLAPYRLALYTATDDIESRARELGRRSGMELEVVSTAAAPVGHERILRLHGEARVSISLSESDAICTSFLEAMVMGSFPIQSDTGCSDEWASDGRSALFVPPDDPEAVAAALRRALGDDSLVEAAAKLNAATADARLDEAVVDRKMAEAYEWIQREIEGPGPRRRRAGRVAEPEPRSFYDSELLERDAHIAVLRQHVSDMQRSLDGLHKQLEGGAPSPPAGRPSVLRRLVRRARAAASRRLARPSQESGQ